MTGSVAGRPALKTETKTPPDTTFVPRLPLRVTLISRPDTPRRERSMADSAPVFVRASFAKIADRAAQV